MVRQLNPSCPRVLSSRHAHCDSQRAVILVTLAVPVAAARASQPKCELSQIEGGCGGDGADEEEKRSAGVTELAPEFGVAHGLAEPPGAVVAARWVAE